MAEYIIKGVFEDCVVAPRQITDEQLLEVSGNLWDSTDYGAAAVSLLELERRHARTSVWAIDDFPLPWQSEAEKRRPLAAPRSEQEMAEIVLDMWDQAHYPFEPSVRYLERTGVDNFYPGMSGCSPGFLTRLRLADFSRSRNYDKHELHGTLGKTFDVLTVAAGIKKASEVGSSHIETEFITAKDLRAHLRNIELPPSYRKEINYVLADAISDEIHRAVAPEYGEVIFEGYLSGSGHKFEKVAVASLVAMAKNFPKERPTAQALLKLASS